MIESLVQSGTGAIVGFLLAQLVNCAKLGHEWYKRPRIVLQSRDKDTVLEVTERHKVYGFSLQNVGRRIATGIRVQLVKIEARHGERHICLLHNAYDLRPYRQERSDSPLVPITLFPGAQIDIALASRYEENTEHADVAWPSVPELPELFEELAAEANEYLYTVVAFDEKDHAAWRVFSLR